jgi:hypothetical protein
MDVEDQLAGILVAIGDQPETLFIQAVPAAEISGGLLHLAHNYKVIFLYIKKGRNVFFRNKKEMYGRSRANVLKGQNTVVFINYFGRDLPLNDLAKNTILHWNTSSQLQIDQGSRIQHIPIQHNLR